MIFLFCSSHFLFLCLTIFDASSSLVYILGFSVNSCFVVVTGCFLLLSRSKELTHYGIIQKVLCPRYPTGLLVNIVDTCGPCTNGM